MLCLVGAWIIFSNQTKADFLGKEISEISLKIKDLSTAVEEAKKGQQDKLAREKRKNVELEEGEQTSIKEITDLSRKRDEMKLNLNESEKEIEIIAANIQKTKVSLAGIDKEIETSRNAFNDLVSGIPILQSNVTSLKNQILNQRERRKELDEEILTYDKETEILKEH